MERKTEFSWWLFGGVIIAFLCYIIWHQSVVSDFKKKLADRDAADILTALNAKNAEIELKNKLKGYEDDLFFARAKVKELADQKQKVLIRHVRDIVRDDSDFLTVGFIRLHNLAVDETSDDLSGVNFAQGVLSAPSKVGQDTGLEVIIRNYQQCLQLQKDYDFVLAWEKQRVELETQRNLNLSKTSHR